MDNPPIDESVPALLANADDEPGEAPQFHGRAIANLHHRLTVIEGVEAKRGVAALADDKRLAEIESGVAYLGAVAAGMGKRLVALERVHGFPPDRESPSEACERLGINVAEWADETRAKVDAAFARRDPVPAAPVVAQAAPRVVPREPPAHQILGADSEGAFPAGSCCNGCTYPIEAHRLRENLDAARREAKQLRDDLGVAEQARDELRGAFEVENRIANRSSMEAAELRGTHDSLVDGNDRLAKQLMEERDRSTAAIRTLEGQLAAAVADVASLRLVVGERLAPDAVAAERDELARELVIVRSHLAAVRVQLEGARAQQRGEVPPDLGRLRDRLQATERAAEAHALEASRARADLVTMRASRKTAQSAIDALEAKLKAAQERNGRLKVDLKEARRELRRRTAAALERLAAKPPAKKAKP